MESIAGESKSVRVPRCLASVGVVVAALSACTTPGTTADSYELVLNAPGLETVQPKVVVTHDGDYSQVKRSVWNARQATWPHADLVFWRIKDTFRKQQAYTYEDSLPEFIGAFLPGENITLGAGGNTKNALGRLTFQRFRRGQFAECIFIEQGISRFSDQLEVVGAGEPLGDMVIRGWYCVGPTEQNQDADFNAFIAGIGIAGWSLPAQVNVVTLVGVHQAIFEDYGTPHYRDGQVYDYYTGIATGTSGDIIVAAAAGTVDYVASSDNQERLHIHHGRGKDGLHLRTEYWHHQAIFVKEGDAVIRGQRIGIVGGRKRSFLYFRVVKAPENLYGASSGWIPENPHDYWLDGPGEITCFEPGTTYPQEFSMKLTWPLKCR